MKKAKKKLAITQKQSTVNTSYLRQAHREVKNANLQTREAIERV
jgi:hypothetical protein